MPFDSRRHLIPNELAKSNPIRLRHAPPRLQLGRFRPKLEASAFTSFSA
jgi:hypothetical protein